MNHTLEVIYDTSDAENLTEVDEFLAMLNKFEAENLDTEVLYHEWNLLTPEEREDLSERFKPRFEEDDDEDDFDDEENESYSGGGDDDDDGDVYDDDDFDDELEEEDEEDIRVPMIIFNEKPLIEGYYPNAEEFHAAIESSLETKDFE